MEGLFWIAMIIFLLIILFILAISTLGLVGGLILFGLRYSRSHFREEIPGWLPAILVVVGAIPFLCLCFMNFPYIASIIKERFYSP